MIEIPPPDQPTATDLTSLSGRPSNLRIPDHELLRCIGKGSYGEVWLGRNVLGTYRAIKIVYRDTFDNARPYEREFNGIKKFEPVSRTHEGLMDILQAGREDQAGYFYYVMELGDDVHRGQEIVPEEYQPRTLRREMANGERLNCTDCLQIGLSLASALSHLHKNGLIHRDIKPSNIIFVHGTAKIADIGLVAAVGSSLTFVGTEGFIPPEGPGTPQADVYSLGKVLYEISTGKDRQSFPELPTNLAEAPDQKQLLELNEVILKACETNLRQRFKSANEMHAELVLLLGGKSVKRLRLLERRWAVLSRAALAGVLCLVAVMAVAYQVNREMKRAAEDRQREVGSYIAYGSRAIEEGNLSASLPWFIEALRLDSKDPEKVANHRLRIGAVLEQSPKIVQMWFLPDALVYVEFNRTGDELLVAGLEKGVQIFDLKTGQSTTPPFAAAVGFAKASFSSDGQHVITAGTDHSAKVWNLHSLSAPVLTLEHDQLVTSAQYSRQGDAILTSSGTNAWAWKSEGGELEKVFKGHKEALLHSAFSPDGSRIVTTSRDSTALLWDRASGKPLLPPLRHAQWVYYATFSPDGSRVATASFDRTVRVWDSRTGQQVLDPLRHEDGIQNVEFSPDGNFILTAGHDFAVRIWSSKNGSLVAGPLNHSGRVLHAGFSPDGKLVVSACWDGTVRVWNVEPHLKFRPKIPGLVDPTGDFMATLQTNGIKIEDVRTGSHISTIPTYEPPLKMIFNSTGERLLIITERLKLEGTNAYSAQIWNARKGTPIGKPMEIPFPHNIWFSPDGKMVAAHEEKAVLLHGDQLNQPPIRFQVPWGPVNKIYFDGRSSRLMVVGNNHVQVYDSTGNALSPVLNHPASVTHTEFSPDGRMLVTTCKDNVFNEFGAQLWDSRTWKKIAPLLAHRDGVLHASFSPDSRKVVTSGEDFTAMIWEAGTGRPLLKQPLHHAHQISSAAFSQNGQWIVTSGKDKIARIWDSSTGDPITPPMLHEETLQEAAFISRDTRVLTRRSNGEARLWSLTMENRSVEDLALIAQLLSARPYTHQATMSSSNNDLSEIWTTLRRKYPGEFSLR